MNFKRLIFVFLASYVLLCVILLKFYKTPVFRTTENYSANLESGRVKEVVEEALTTEVSLSSSDGHSSSETKKPREMTTEEYNKWCVELASVSIYQLGGKLHCNDNSQAFSLGLMLAVLLTIVIEVVTHRIEHRLKNKTHLIILNKVYKELMMMGFISFSVQVLESVGLFEIIFEAFQSGSTVQSLHELTERRVKIFELVHVILFVLSIFYVLIVIISFFLVRGTWRRWKAHEQLTEATAVKNYAEAREKYYSHNWIVRLLSIRLLWKVIAAIDQMHYWSVRSRFVKVNHLKKTFRFDIYLKHRIRILYSDIAEVGANVWGTIFAFAMLNYLRLRVVNIPTGEDGGLLSFTLVFGLGSAVVYLLFFMFFRIAYFVYVKKHGLGSAKYKVQMYTNNVSVNDDKKESLLSDSFMSGEVTTPATSESQQTNQEVKFELPEEDELTSPSIALSAHKKLSTLKEVEHINLYNYFIMRSPEFSFLLLQLVLLAQSFYIAMILTHFTHIIFNEFEVWGGFKILILVATFIPTLLVCLVFFPWSIAPFTVLSSVDNFTNRHHIKKAIELARANNSNDYEKHAHEDPYFVSVAHSNKLAWQKFVRKQQSNSHAHHHGHKHEKHGKHHDKHDHHKTQHGGHEVTAHQQHQTHHQEQQHHSTEEHH